MSLLRSSRYWKIVDTFLHKATYQTLNGGRIASAPQLRRLAGFDFRTYSLAPNPSIVDESIRKLDDGVRRSGRVTKDEVVKLLEFCTSLKKATSTQALMIIRCCGNLLPDETPATRIALAQEVWNTFENLGVPLDISHYNSLLRVYNENGHKFSPSDFLSNLQTKGIEPNRVTFQHLVAAYCQQGDLGGAQKILEYMKEKSLPINEHIFRSLIDGHSRVKDMESAHGILSIMTQADIEIDAETYTALMCGYARNGDLESLMKLWEECQTQNIDIADKDLLEVCFTAAVTGHSEILDKVISVLPKRPGFNQDAKNIILRLISAGDEASALKIFKSMPPIGANEQDDIPPASGNFVIKQLIKNNGSVEQIVALCNELMESGENKYALHYATEMALLHCNPTTSLFLLSKLAGVDTSCQHYYWPLLVKFGKKKDLTGISQTLRQMFEDLQQPPTAETISDYVIPYLSPGEAAINELRQGGVSTASAAFSVVLNLLTQNNIQEAARIALLYRAQYGSPFLRRFLVKAFCATGDVDSFISLVRVFQSGENIDDIVYRENVLQDTVSSLNIGRNTLIPKVLEKFLEAGLRISVDSANIIKDSLKAEELTDHVSSLLGRLVSTELVPIELKRPTARYIAHERDESGLLKSIEAVENKGESSMGLKRRLLTVYCHRKDLEKAEALAKEMEQEGFEFQSGLLLLLMDVYAAHDKVVEAKKYYDLFMKNSEDFDLDESKILRLALTYVKHDMVEDAISLFQRHQRKEEVVGKGNITYCWKLLNALAEKGDKALLKRMFDTMLESNFMEVSNIVLGPLIKVHIINNDLKGALDQFEECCTRHRATPWKNELACKLIQSEDAVALQRLTDLSTQIHGEINSLYDLVLSFIECGRMRQARKILETPGLRARAQRLIQSCERYVSEGQAEHLENLLEVTKDFPHINRSTIYLHLLKCYCNADEVDKAYGLWTSIQEENVQPTDEFLVILSHILNKHSRPVPFNVPVVEMITKTVTKKDPRDPMISDQLKAFRRAVYGKFLDEAIVFYHKLSENELSTGDRSRFLNLMVNNGRIGEAAKILIEYLQKGLNVHLRPLNYIINHVAKSGDIDSLNAIGTLLDENTKRFVSFSNRVTHCMVEAGKAAEVLDQMEKAIDAANSQEEINQVREGFPRGGIYSVFESNPELIPRFEELSMKYFKKGIYAPVNILWIHFTMSKNKEMADKYWKLLSPGQRILFQPIVKRARTDLDIATLDELMARCKSLDVPSESLASIHNAIIDCCLQMTDIRECTKRLDAAMSECEPESLSRNLLIRVKRAVEERNLVFKYTIPPRRGPKDSSSSSSDSDSETEAVSESR